MASSENCSNIPTINPISSALIPMQYYSEPPALEIARLVFEASLAVLGVLGNILVCVVISRMRTKTAINRYLFNLGIADIGVLTIVFPMAVLQEQVKTYFPLGKGICLYVYPTIDTFYGASVWLVTCVAVERYINIVKRIEVYRGRSLATTSMTIVAIWVVSFTIVSLPLFFVIEFDEKTSACFVNWFRKPSFLLWKQIYTITLTIFTYVFPFGIISWTYVQIGSRLAQSTGFHKDIERKCSTVSRGKSAKRSKKEENHRLKENTKAKRILTPLVVTFAVSMLPINIFRLVALYWPRVFFLEYFWVLYNVLVIFTTANSAVNPIIYSIVSREFRRGFKRLFVRGKQRMRDWTFRSTAIRESHVSFYPNEWPKLEVLRETDV